MNFWITVLAPFLKPEVDALTTELEAQETTIVAEVNAEVAAGVPAAEAFANSVVAKLPSSFLFNLVKPEIGPALALAFADLAGAITANDSTWFAAGIAKLKTFEASVGL